MRSQLLGEEGGLRTFAVVMDRGDEAVDELLRFARAEGVTAASLTAIGAASSAEIGWFDPDADEYRFQRYDEQLELASCIGDVGVAPEGGPALHLHVVLGRRDHTALAGHLKSLTVFPTTEVTLVESPVHLRKRMDPRLGIALFDLPGPRA